MDANEQEVKALVDALTEAVPSPLEKEQSTVSIATCIKRVKFTIVIF